MSLKFRCIPFFLVLTVFAAPLWTASPTVAADTATESVRIFKLQRSSTAMEDELDLEEEELERWRPAINSGTIEVSLTLGFMNLATTLLQHDQIIYRYEPEATYWGDVEITGESAFNPTLQIGYSVTPWFTLGAFGGMSVSEYSASITNRKMRENTEGMAPVDDPALGEYDPEQRSLITLQGGLSATVYPFDITDDGGGRWHPFLIASAGRISYDMNSNFTAGSAGASDVAFGGGLRLLADRNVSIRLQALYHVNTVEFTPAEFFIELDEGTTQVPLREYPEQEGGSFLEQPVESFSSQDLGYLAWSLGVHGSF